VPFGVFCSEVRAALERWVVFRGCRPEHQAPDMSTSQPSIPFDSLLAHQDFVRSLARSLVNDAQAADDVAQETWLTALKSPPREGHSLRGWLAAVVRSRAQNARREDTRRNVREELVARGEVDESDKVLRTQVEVSQNIVAVVLALDEPYRSVILQRYYEDLQPTEIARRRGVAPGTIRSQLSRGHELLREKLDRQYGDRSAWSVMVLPLIQRGVAKSLKFSTKVWLAAGVVTIVVVAPIVWYEATTSTTRATVAALSPEIRSSNAIALSPAPAMAASSRTSAAPQPIESQETKAAAGGATAIPSDLSSKSPRELVELMVQTQRLLERRVLVNAGDWPPALAALKQNADAGMFWIEPRGRFDFESANPFGLRGGGAFYSFVTRSHSYDRDPDIGLDAAGTLNANVMGSGFIVSIGKLDLLQVPGTASATIDTWSARVKDAWTVLWSESGVIEERATKSNLQPWARAAVGETYVVRRPSRNDHDVLAAFTVLEERDHALRIAFRVLNSWPVVDQHGPIDGTAYDESIGAAPAWVDALSVEQLFALADQILARSRVVLLSIPDPLQLRFATLMAAPNSGVARVLERGRFDHIVTERGGGCYWSFATRAHDYDKEPDLELGGGELRSGFYGASMGMVLDLGDMRIGDVPAQRGSAPAQLESGARERWTFMWSVMPHVWNRFGQQINALDDEQRLRADDLGLRQGAEARMGHCYLVRSVMPDEHDLIAAFEVVDRDENGITIAWRVLETFPVPRRR
jgi:RNA polymerase sigma factor (sigma-70 family)